MIVIDLVVWMAAANVALPNWLAATVQVPATSPVKVVFLVTEHVFGVNELKVMVSKGAAVAFKVTIDLTFSEVIVGLVKVKVMVWAVFGAARATTLNVLVIGVAAAKLISPAWLAITLQLPGAIAVTVVPETEHIVDVSVLKLTLSPEEADADKAPVPPTVNWVGEVGKMMVWLGSTAEKKAVMLSAGSETESSAITVDTPLYKRELGRLRSFNTVLFPEKYKSLAWPRLVLASMVETLSASTRSMNL